MSSITPVSAYRRTLFSGKSNNRSPSQGVAFGSKSHLSPTEGSTSERPWDENFGKAVQRTASPNHDIAIIDAAIQNVSAAESPRHGNFLKRLLQPATKGSTSERAPWDENFGKGGTSTSERTLWDENFGGGRQVASTARAPLSQDEIATMKDAFTPAWLKHQHNPNNGSAFSITEERLKQCHLSLSWLERLAENLTARLEAS